MPVLQPLQPSQPVNAHPSWIAIQSLDFTNLRTKLLQELPDWTEDELNFVEDRYRKFLFLLCIDKTPAVPTIQIDEFWHRHILDTRAYIRDCEHIAGKYLHHYPYMGLTEETEKQLKSNFELTKQNWIEVFGEPYQGNRGACYWTSCRDCQGRCQDSKCSSHSVDPSLFTHG